ncbi:hypothetical protein CH63R_07771 [Colletotrichum higginsianum IMI 349063]|uniref:Uncharacterized protein n=1 Tax=Colletotrichum higginsianum (strain IMI 349063) TaxID=759273 RepID=A0A1B7YAC2_COLHI|nr:hypothetical protein CH63R_07771 [Colletotrichum higginsianum IMI 349063]OBR09006.1 hypothetical protein CH63R_07771 [Colletotrichum higginsianum IMI 349063]
MWLFESTVPDPNLNSRSSPAFCKSSEPDGERHERFVDWAYLVSHIAQCVDFACKHTSNPFRITADSEVQEKRFK